MGTPENDPTPVTADVFEYCCWPDPFVSAEIFMPQDGVPPVVIKSPDMLLAFFGTIPEILNNVHDASFVVELRACSETKYILLSN